MFSKPPAICLLIVFGFFLLAAQSELWRDHKIYADGALLNHLSLSVPLQASEVRLFFPQDGYSDFISVTYKADTKASISNNFDKISQVCEKDQELGYRCNFHFVTKGDAQDNILVKFPGRASIKLGKITYLKQKATANLSAGILLQVLLVIFLLMPVLWLIHARRALSQWLILGTSILILVKVQPWFTGILLIFLSASYYFGVSYQSTKRRIYKPLYILLTSITFLIFAKYFNTALSSVFANPGAFNLYFPIGVSYFIIRVIDTQLKWYRGELEHITIREYLLFVLFPPTIPAGPIETIDKFFKNRRQRITHRDILQGLTRIIIGLFQKIFMVDYLIAPYLFGSNGLFFSMTEPDQQSMTVVPLLMLSLIFVYIDFSAYSNIAIGLSRLMGYKISENFNWPVISTNPREFWKRWHMTLSNWCMRNIYFPLMIKTRQIFLPSFMVMFTVGVWHALSVSWILWAVHHSFGIYVFGKLENRSVFRKLLENNFCKFPVRFAGIMFTVLFVSAGHAFAQYEDVHVAIRLYINFWIQLPAYLHQQVISLLGA